MPLVALNRRQVSVLVGLNPILRTEGEVFEELLNRVRVRDKVGVKDHHKLGPRIHLINRFLQGHAFVAAAVVAVDNLDPGVLFPFLQNGHGFIRGVIRDNHLIVGIIKPGAGRQNPVCHFLLVVKSQEDTDKRLPGGIIAVSKVRQKPGQVLAVSVLIIPPEEEAVE